VAGRFAETAGRGSLLNPSRTSYFEFCNTGRPHSSLGGQTPDTAYCGNGEWKNEVPAYAYRAFMFTLESR